MGPENALTTRESPITRFCSRCIKYGFMLAVPMGLLTMLLAFAGLRPLAAVTFWIGASGAIAVGVGVACSFVRNVAAIWRGLFGRAPG